MWIDCLCVTNSVRGIAKEETIPHLACLSSASRSLINSDFGLFFENPRGSKKPNGFVSPKN